jgi:hypothetical protein
MEIVSEKRCVDVRKPNRFQKVAIALGRTRSLRRDCCDTAELVKDKDDWRKKPYTSVPVDINVGKAYVPQKQIESNQTKSSMNIFMKRKIESPRFAANNVSADSPNTIKEIILNRNFIEIKAQDDCSRSVSSTSRSFNTRRAKAQRQKVENVDTTYPSSDIVLNGRITDKKAFEGQHGNAVGDQPVSWTTKVHRSPKTEHKRRNSTATVSLYDEDKSPLYLEGKRRNSMSALASLSLCEMQLSPFRRNSPMFKRASSNLKHSCRRLLAMPLPLTEDEMICSGRKVAFVVQSDGSIQTDVVESNLTLSEDEVKTLWWSKPERRAMKRKAQKIAIKFLSVTAKYHLAVDQILSQCGNNNHKDCHAFFSEREALRFLIHHDARGLELAMISSLNLPSCKMYHKSCKSSVKEVLNIQATGKCSSLKSADEKVHKIAAQYHQASASATQFACILAEGDMRVARGAYAKMNGTDDASILTAALTDESSFSTSSSASDEDFSDGSLTI